MHDLVIENARVYDGTGAPPIEGAVAVSAGKIAAVGEDVGSGETVVDAEGLSLAPGIIDSHTHYDAQLTWDPYAIPSTLLGVSTVIIGNCGFSIAPCHPEDRDLTMRHLENVEAMPLEALRAGTRWEFETFAEYLDLLERGGTVPNVAAYCGHSALRTWVLREEATKRAATDDEVAEMKAVLRGALDAGAIGFSTSTFEGHNGADGVPMPSRLADETELRSLAATLGEAGKGIFIASQGAKDVAFAESLAAEIGRPTLLTGIIHNPATPESCFEEMAAVNAAQARGLPVYAQVACSPISFIFTLSSPYPFEGLKAWQPAFAVYKYPGALAGLYRDPDFRQAVREELVSPESGAKLFTEQWDRLEIVEAAKPENKRLEGRNVAELAAAEGTDPLDWFLDFGIAEDFATRFYAEMLNYEDDQVERLLLDPAGHPSLSDGGPTRNAVRRGLRAPHAGPLGARARRLHGRGGDSQGHLGARGDLRHQGPRAKLRRACTPTSSCSIPIPWRADRSMSSTIWPAGAARITTDGLGVHGVWVNGWRIVDGEGIIESEHRPGALLREFSS